MPDEPRPPRDWKETVTGWALSLVVHTGLVLLLGIITWSVTAPPQVEALITLGSPDLVSEALGDLDADRSRKPAEDTQLERSEASPTLSLPTNTTQAREAAPTVDSLELDASAFTVTDNTLSILQAGETKTVATGLASSELLKGTSSEFQSLARGLGRQGLDVVLVLDATGSMGGYMKQAKGRIVDIMDVLTGILKTEEQADPRLVRFGVVAFKDYTDDFGRDATIHLPLQADAQRVRWFLNRIEAGGGGDTPEPIHRAFKRATSQDMGWRRSRKSIILLIGDAPVHRTGRAQAEREAQRFAQNYNGTLHTIDVGRGDRFAPLPDYQRFAAAGNGRAFLLTDESRFWQELIHSIFGPRFTRDLDLVLERFLKSRDE